MLERKLKLKRCDRKCGSPKELFVGAVHLVDDVHRSEATNAKMYKFSKGKPTQEAGRCLKIGEGLDKAALRLVAIKKLSNSYYCGW